MDVLCQKPIGDSGEPILFLNNRWDAGLGGHPQQGTACKAAYADGDVGTESPDDVTADPNGTRKSEWEEQVAEGQPAVNSRDGEACDDVSCSGHALHFHAPPGADELDGDIGPLRFERFSDGQHARALCRHALLYQALC